MASEQILAARRVQAQMDQARALEDIARRLAAIEAKLGIGTDAVTAEAKASEPVSKPTRSRANKPTGEPKADEPASQPAGEPTE